MNLSIGSCKEGSPLFSLSTREMCPAVLTLCLAMAYAAPVSGES